MPAAPQPAPDAPEGAGGSAREDADAPAKAPPATIDRNLLSSSHRGLRVLVWIVALPLGLLVSAVCAGMRMPDAPWQLIVGLGVAMWPVFAVLFDRVVVLRAEAFDAVFSGDLQACQRLLARRFNSLPASLDLYGTAALELAVGDVLAARRRLATIPKARIGPALTIKRLLDAHLAVMDANPEERAKTLGMLLTIHPSRKVWRRYRAYLLAQAALHEPVVFVELDGQRRRDPRALQIHDDLCRRAAAEIRAYGDPVATHFARFIEASRSLAPVAGELPQDLRVSAMLARSYGVGPIADEIDARASAAERAEAKKGPYRA
ncbi:MAG: hypothetical protein U0414_35855 [Polyangiaceae bacterium]